MVRSWLGRVQNAGLLSIAARFPVPVFCAASVSILVWLRIDAEEANSGWWHLLGASFQHLLPFLALAFLFSFAAQLHGEATGKRVHAWAAQALGVAALAVCFDAFGGLRLLVFPSQTDVLTAAIQAGTYVQPPVFTASLLGALLLLPFVAPYARYEAQPGAFWQFSHKLTVAALTALAGAGLAFGGISAVFGTAKMLFDIAVPGRAYAYAAGVSFVLGAPLILLALTPASFEEPPRTGEAKEFTSRSVSLLVRFILIPLATILSAMLLAFAALVLLQGRFESARLGLRGLLYGAGIVVTALLAYPDIEESRIARIFMRLWPWFLIPPTAMLFPSIWIRVAEYGWTPFRYFVFLAGIWMALVAAAGLRWRHELRTVPGFLAILLILAIVGPWSVTSVTGRSQARQLEAILTAKGLLAGGKWQGHEVPIWYNGEQQTIVSALNALEEGGQLHRLKPWFEGAADSPFAEAGGWRKEMGRKLNVDWYPGYRNKPATVVRFYSPKPRILKVPSESILIGPIDTNSSAYWPHSTFDTPAGRLDVHAKGKTIEVGEAGGKTVKFALDALLSDAKNSRQPPSEEQTDITLTEPQMRVLDGEGSLQAKAAIAEASLNATNDTLHTELYLVLPAK